MAAARPTRISIALVLIVLAAALSSCGHTTAGTALSVNPGSDEVQLPPSFQSVSFGSIILRNTSPHVVTLDEIRLMGSQGASRTLGVLIALDSEQKQGAFYTDDCGFPPMRMLTHRLRGFTIRAGGSVAVVIGAHPTGTEGSTVRVLRSLRVRYHTAANLRAVVQLLPHEIRVKFHPQTAHNALCDIPPADRDGRVL